MGNSNSVLQQLSREEEEEYEYARLVEAVETAQAAHLAAQPPPEQYRPNLPRPSSGEYNVPITFNASSSQDIPSTQPLQPNAPAIEHAETNDSSRTAVNPELLANHSSSASHTLGALSGPRVLFSPPARYNFVEPSLHTESIPERYTDSSTYERWSHSFAEPACFTGNPQPPGPMCFTGNPQPPDPAPTMTQEPATWTASLEMPIAHPSGFVAEPPSPETHENRVLPGSMTPSPTPVIIQPPYQPSVPTMAIDQPTYSDVAAPPTEPALEYGVLVRCSVEVAPDHSSSAESEEWGSYESIAPPAETAAAQHRSEDHPIVVLPPSEPSVSQQYEIPSFIAVQLPSALRSSGSAEENHGLPPGWSSPSAWGRTRFLEQSRSGESYNTSRDSPISRPPSSECRACTDVGQEVQLRSSSGAERPSRFRRSRYESPLPEDRQRRSRSSSFARACSSRSRGPGRGLNSSQRGYCREPPPSMGRWDARYGKRSEYPPRSPSPVVRLPSPVESLWHRSLERSPKRMRTRSPSPISIRGRRPQSIHYRPPSSCVPSIATAPPPRKVEVPLPAEGKRPHEVTVIIRTESPSRTGTKHKDNDEATHPQVRPSWEELRGEKLPEVLAKPYANIVHAVGLPQLLRNKKLEDGWKPAWQIFPLKVFRGADYKILKIDAGWDDEALLTELGAMYDELRRFWRKWFSLRSVASITMVMADHSIIYPQRVGPAKVSSSKHMRLRWFLRHPSYMRGRHEFMQVLTSRTDLGIEFVERWQVARIAVAVILPVLASTAIGVVYSVAARDPSTAFTIAGYVTSAYSVCLVLVGLLNFVDS